MMRIDTLQLVTPPSAMNSETLDEGAELRLCSEVRTLVHGASLDAMKKLGVDTLKMIRKILTVELAVNACTDFELTQLASEVKQQISTPLEVADLKRLGKPRLLELSGRGYSLNSVIDATSRAG
jgi:hypothetical protein